ncbi:MAG: hypothetical protein NW220_05865 [Leptolyngbyaceae cyanobacterium bins.349]|nr:hypothetical protein [Leptolyngbyaceae cyanobacterium bins.349]
MLRLFLFSVLTVTLALFAAGGNKELAIPASQAATPLTKITIDLTRISPAGLVGPPDGLRSMSYEFCIPRHEAAIAEIQAIDPTLQYARSPGRIRCSQDQYLVIGNTHKPNWREILTKLAQLDYVQRIDQFFGE